MDTTLELLRTQIPPRSAADPTTDLLIRARSILQRGWCKGAPARDAEGNRIQFTDARAVAWSPTGALALACDSIIGATFSAATRRLTAAVGGEQIATFNSRQESGGPVLAAFDRAIAAGGR